MPTSLLILGGEAADGAWLDSLAEEFPGVSILNHYGPTEATVGVATHALRSPSRFCASGAPPIGRPLSNDCLHLLSADLKPEPIGVIADLYIGGRSVTRGYAQSPELTAERFLPDPLAFTVGALMYASGDSARRLADGSVEFLGRRDDQVKIRGFRVELREIEQALLEHSGVTQAAVLAQERSDHPGSLTLHAYVAPEPARARSIAGYNRYTLPNNMAIVHLNRNETDYLYKEVFQLQAYLRFGVHIDSGSVVFDVGANIGLFTLFVNQVFQASKVFSFEPNPAAFEILRLNSSLYAPCTRLFNFGLGASERSADFTHFPRFSLFSGLHADPDTEKRVVKRFVANQTPMPGLGNFALEELPDELLEERFEAQGLQIRLRSISDVIDENEVDQIDLLKINVEKSELEVLTGVREEHWRRINQIVLEVDLNENLSRISEMLCVHGYDVNLFQDRLLEGTDLHYVYARRTGCERIDNGDFHPVPVPKLTDSFLEPADLETFLMARLPNHMIPNTITILDRLPLNANGKIDRRALSGLGLNKPAAEFVPPGSSTERAIASIWKDVLRVEKVSVNDNFFAAGGTSLLLAQVCSELRRRLHTPTSVIELFRYPTVRSLAEYISTDSKSTPNEFSPKLRGAGRRKAASVRARSSKTNSH
ncbi:MAG TPA: FkbM family methyltransferase, partial [Blastocatellia bacterium]|nr:FkbM family methyltransferase [Blastocatellia bacterium]